MCEAKPGQRCAGDTQGECRDTAAAYTSAFPDGPAVTPLDASTPPRPTIAIADDWAVDAEGTLYCADCAPEDAGPSGAYPGTATDSPDHCAKCEALLPVDLSADGVAYVAEELGGDGRPEVLEAWRQQYSDELDRHFAAHPDDPRPLRATEAMEDGGMWLNDFEHGDRAFDTIDVEHDATSNSFRARGRALVDATAAVPNTVTDEAIDDYLLSRRGAVEAWAVEKYGATGVVLNPGGEVEPTFEATLPSNASTADLLDALHAQTKVDELTGARDGHGDLARRLHG